MKGLLLDTNLPIAVFWPQHERHELAVKWFSRHRAKVWATGPFTEAGFIRIVSNPAFSRDAVQRLRPAAHRRGARLLRGQIPLSDVLPTAP